MSTVAHTHKQMLNENKKKKLCQTKIRKFNYCIADKKYWEIITGN